MKPPPDVLAEFDASLATYATALQQTLRREYIVTEEPSFLDRLRGSVASFDHSPAPSFLDRLRGFAFNPDQPRDDHGRWSGEGHKDVQDTLDNADTVEGVQAALNSMGAERTSIGRGEGKSAVYLVGDHTVVEWDGKDAYPTAEDRNDWLARADVESLFPDYADEFNNDFWASGRQVYHATTATNADAIMQEGLNAASNTRGISNRSVGDAIYVTTNPDEARDGSYGDTILTINTKALAEDRGRLYASEEPDVADAYMRTALAHQLGVDSYEPDTERGMSPDTVVLRGGSIAPKFITRTDIKEFYSPDQPRDDHGRWGDGGGDGSGKGGVGFATHDSWKAQDADSNYVYHATNSDNLAEIVSAGSLDTHAPDFGTEQDAWPDGKTEDRSYFTDAPAAAWKFAPEEGTPVLLRFERTAGTFRKESGTKDVYTRDTLKASAAEFLGADGKWHPLAKAFTARKDFYSPDQPRDDHGRWTDGSGGPSPNEASPSLAGKSGRGNIKIPPPSPIDPTFAAMTTHEAEQYLMNVHNITARLGGVDQVHIGGILQEVEDLNTQYPGILKQITTDDPGGTAGKWGDADNARVWAYGGGNEYGIWLNPNYYRDPTFADQVTAQTIDHLINGVIMPGWHDGMNDPRSIVAHEFGHVLDNYLQRTGALAFTPGGIVRSSGFGFVSNTHLMFKNEHFAALSNKRAVPITQYARSNDMEWFAETFAATRYGDKRARNSMDFYNMRSYLNIVANPANHSTTYGYFNSSMTDADKAAANEFFADAAKKIGVKKWM